MYNKATLIALRIWHKEESKRHKVIAKDLKKQIKEMK